MIGPFLYFPLPLSLAEVFIAAGTIGRVKQIAHTKIYGSADLCCAIHWELQHHTGNPAAERLRPPLSISYASPVLSAAANSALCEKRHEQQQQTKPLHKMEYTWLGYIHYLLPLLSCLKSEEQGYFFLYREHPFPGGLLRFSAATFTGKGREKQ